MEAPQVLDLTSFQEHSREPATLPRHHLLSKASNFIDGMVCLLVLRFQQGFGQGRVV